MSINKKVEEGRKENERRRILHAQQRLKHNIDKKFNTTMIGAISAFEEEFGELWGHGKMSHQLTDNENEWKEKWEVVRTKILNNGNTQRRAADQEISEYDMQWRQYRMTFFPVSKLTEKTGEDG